MGNNILDEIEKQIADENLNGKRPVTKPKFKVYREVSGKTDTFEIGDRIKIKINGEKHFATAIQQKGDMTLFILDDCLNEAKTMECEGEPCYEDSETRKFLRNCKVSKKYRDYLVPAKDWYGTELPWNPWLEDKLFLLSVNQICEWDDSTELIDWFKNNYKNRIATIQGDHTYWWIRVRNYAYDFNCVVCDNGSITDNCSPEDCFGVRPAFVLRTGGNNK